MRKNRKTTQKVNHSVSFFFLSSILQKSENFARHIDSQTNILVGLSSGIFVLSISQIITESGSTSLPLLILAMFSLSSALMALFAVVPPRIMRKKGQKESLLYNKEIASFKSADHYERELSRACHDLDKIIHEYSVELYNLSNYYYQPKRRLFKYSRHLLLFGIFLSLIAMVIN